MWLLKDVYTFFMYLTMNLIFVNSTPNIGTVREKCYKSDPNLNECMSRSLQNLKPSIKAGIPAYSVPSLDPFIVPEITVNQKIRSRNYEITSTNVVVSKLSQFEVENFRADTEQFIIKVRLPVVSAATEYQAKTHIIVPQSGNGTCAWDCVNVDATVTLQRHDLPQNKFYYRVFDTRIDLDDFDFRSRTFRGPSVFGKIRKFLDGGWRNSKEELKPAFKKTMEITVTDFFNAIYSKFPLEVLLPLQKS